MLPYVYILPTEISKLAGGRIPGSHNEKGLRMGAFCPRMTYHGKAWHIVAPPASMTVS